MNDDFGIPDVYSTSLKDGEDLEKLNLWLSQYRGDELLKFHASRITRDTTKIILEADRSGRLRIMATWPPHQSYLQTNKTIPYIYVAFTEPVDWDSVTGNVLFNGAVVSRDLYCQLLNNDYVLRIDTSGLGTLTSAGQRELILVDILHTNKVWKLCGERKLIWTTAEHGGSRGGEDSYDPDKRCLSIARVLSERAMDEQQMMLEFYAQYQVDKDDVVSTQLVNAYPEHDKTILYVIYKVSPRIPYVKCINPKYKACYYQDAPNPIEMKIEIGLTEPIDLSYLYGKIFFDTTPVANNKISLSQNNQLLTVLVTPAAYKHHSILISGMKSDGYIRSWPFYSSFVIHSIHPSVSVLDDLDDVIITSPVANQTLVYNGSNWINTQAPQLPIRSTSGDTNINSNEMVVVKTSGGISTATLPASPSDGDICIVKRSGINNLIVDGNGSPIDDASSTMTLSSDLLTVELRYDATTDVWWVS